MDEGASVSDREEKERKKELSFSSERYSVLRHTRQYTHSDNSDTLTNGVNKYAY